MSLALSLLLVAAGAILVWAVDVTVSGLHLTTIGWILMAVGAVGVLLSLLVWNSWAPWGAERRAVVRDY
jgi:lipopolysaccharide export LptBFGC system permease protein LptF